MTGLTLAVSMFGTLAACGKAGSQATPDSMSFVVDVELSAAAKNKLQASNESMRVFVSYAGDPVPGVPPGALTPLGFVDLGQAQSELAGEGQAKFDGSAVQRDKLPLLHGEARVNVNVSSARRVFADNILDCDFFEGAIKVAAGSPPKLRCVLLGVETR